MAEQVKGRQSKQIYLPIESQVTLLGEASDEKFANIVAHTAIHYARSSPTLLFSANKGKIARIFQIIENIILLGQERDPSLVSLKPAIHHARLSTEQRRKTEEEIRNGEFRLVLASPTLAQGVNLPFQVVLVYGLEHSPNRPIDDTTFWNVCGRIGRAIVPTQTALWVDRLDPV
ncbi:MAG: helicase-related protein, partial [Planctomycetota bacterium]